MTTMPATDKPVRLVPHALPGIWNAAVRLSSAMLPITICRGEQAVSKPIIRNSATAVEAARRSEGTVVSRCD